VLFSLFPLSLPHLLADLWSASPVVVMLTPVGRLTQDPEIIAGPVLRQPVDETFVWLRGRLAEVIGEGGFAADVYPAGGHRRGAAGRIRRPCRGVRRAVRPGDQWRARPARRPAAPTLVL
jgi:hypothetical protein